MGLRLLKNFPRVAAQISVPDDAVNQSKALGTITSGTLSEPLNGWSSTSYPADAAGASVFFSCSQPITSREFLQSRWIGLVIVALLVTAQRAIHALHREKRDC